MISTVISAIGTVVVGILALIGTVIGSRYSAKVATQTTNNLVLYRIDKLEEKVDKHNQIIERTYKLEEKTAVQEEQIKVANHRIDDLEREKEE